MLCLLPTTLCKPASHHACHCLRNALPSCSTAAYRVPNLTAAKPGAGEDGGTPRREGSATPGGGGSPSRAAADADADAEGGGGTSSSHRWGWGDVAGLSDEDLEAVRLREENELLMENLVRSKLEMAETQSEWSE